MSRKLEISAAAEGQRLDLALAQETGDARNQILKLIKSGSVRVNGVSAIAKQQVKAGDRVEIDAPDEEAASAPPDLEILYDDDDVLVINKPAGLAVHLSESGNPQPTVADFAADQGVEDDDEERPGIVHRLDKDTSGVMVLAKNLLAKAFLQEQFKSRQVKKTYLALVQGRLPQGEAEIRLPIGRSRKAPIKRAVVPGGRESTTHYKVICEFAGATLVEIDLQTGRTHQIRVHFGHIGHPVVGDTLYGDDKPPRTLHRQFLHAKELQFTTPSGKNVKISSPIPEELQDYLDSLG